MRIASIAQRRRRGFVLYNDHPFTGSGQSLYARIGTSVRYRNLRLLSPRLLKGTGGVFTPGAASVLKTNRVASAADPAVEIVWPIPAAMASQTVTFDVRRYEAHVENEIEHFRVRTVELDANRDEVTEIRGTAEFLEAELRDGGIVRLRFVFTPARDGTVVEKFRALRTAGPTSPADATLETTPTERSVLELDTPALSDASPYTYTIRAENAAGTVTKDLLTGIVFTADASGPPAPINGTAEPW